ncbi:ATP-binding cassette domain-containing protein [Promicromonospora sp. AC04]|uniref:ATP-binding cassette domain-containing protein n=1 Tax=Promicromonospora sp. AC04 TaxID=2135723 RepID=UPI001E5BB45D|nr:ATP-binding cassette domain-containing protein [Promicromonospora sp. AC04]
MIPESDVAIETLGLRKAYRSVRGRVVGVDGLDLRVPAGGVHALLGLAGSGKTTTLRLLTGLARADGGAMKVFGTHVPDGLPDLAGRIGAVVGEPGFQARLSGRRNLALLASAAGVPRARVDEVLTRVVLADRAKAAFGTYSADEERRLALAAALLRDPDLLVVDDPSAGLDAVGTREIRQALRRLADQGKTVLVATGVLTEAQQIADTVTVLDGGRVLVQGAVAELLGDAKVSVRVGIDEPGKAAAVLRTAGFKVRADGDVLHVDDVAEPADIGRALAKQKLFASELVPQREDLAAVVGRLRPVVAPTPEPLSRAEERAARKAAERKAADRKKAADQRKADKEAAAKQAAAAEKAAEDAAAKQAAIDARAAAKEAALAERAAAKEAALAERAAAKEARRSAGKPAVSGIALAGERAAAAAAPGPAPKPAAKPAAKLAPSPVSKPASKPVLNPAGNAASPKVTPKALPKSAAKPANAGKTEVKAAAAAETDAPPKQSKLAQRRAAFDAKVAEKQAAAEARLAERKAAADAKAAEKQAAADAKAAAKQAAADARAAAKQAKVETKQARIDDKQAKINDKAAQKQAAINDRAAKKQEAADARAARLAAQKKGATALLSRRAAETSGGQVEPGGRDQGTTTAAAPAGKPKPAADKAPSGSDDAEPEEVELDDLELDELDSESGELDDLQLDDVEPDDVEPDDVEPDDVEPDVWESEDSDPDTPQPGPQQDRARRQGQGRQNPGQQRPGQGRGKKRSKGRR